MKRMLPLFGGLVGAVVCFFATMFLLELVKFGVRGDPIMTGLLGLLVSGFGGIGGTILGTHIGRLLAGPEATGSSLKSLAVVFGLVVIGVGSYAVYSFATATPWLKPGNIVLRYEIRLPPGSTAETARVAEIDLETGQNSMPFSYHRKKKVIEGDPPVIAGEVDLAFRTADRRLDLKIRDQPVQTFVLKIPPAAPHSQFSGWQKHSAGGEARYRVVWPGQD